MLGTYKPSTFSSPSQYSSWALKVSGIIPILQLRELRGEETFLFRLNYWKWLFFQISFKLAARTVFPVFG